MSMHHFVITSFCIATLSCLSPAAQIIWEPSVKTYQGNASDESLVSANGRLLDAINGGSAISETINGVLFSGVAGLTSSDGQSVTTPAGFITVNGTNANDGAFQAGEFSGTAVGRLLDSALWAANSVTLSGLIIGEDYEIQIFSNDARGNRSTNFRGGYGDGTGGGPVGLLQLNNSNTNGTLTFPETNVGDYIIGTFTADAATQSFECFGTNSGGTLNLGDSRAQINGLQLRQLLPDSDGDGLSDESEVNIHGTNPNDGDSDNDGLNDGDEINIYNTDPNDLDSDDDTFSDGDEVGLYNMDPNDEAPLIVSFTANSAAIAQGNQVNLSWLVRGDLSTLTFDGNSVIGSSGLSLTPSNDTTYVLSASKNGSTADRVITVRVFEAGTPIITEFLASNGNGLTDEDGDTSDWIELYNPGTSFLSLNGFHLTDDINDPEKWTFPNVLMPAGSYLTVFASGKNRVATSSELHTNFSLSAIGEYLALIKPDGFTVVDEFAPTYSAQQDDISFGYDSGTNELGYFFNPTPNAVNDSVILGFVEDTRFSVDRGFYSNPFQVILATDTVGAEIRYTTDGSEPTATTGQIYANPVTISQTTVLRAAAFKAQYEPTNVDTHTYIFTADIIDHPNMDTEITQDATYGPQLDASLTAIPTISVTFAGDLNYDERKTSVEFINFEDGDKQVDAGMGRFGSYNTDFAKRSARINFRSEYGPGKLNFDIFDNHEWASFQPAERYDALEIRAGNHDMVARGAYLSNRFTDDSLLDMGQIAPHGRFVHVYMNGEYRGMYHLRERWNAAMLSEYFGGSKDDYEAVNANNGFGADLDIHDGSGDFWRETEVLVDEPNPFTNARSHVDIINEIDFMLLFANGRCENEFRAGGSESQNVPFKFFLKDADGYLRSGSSPFLNPSPLGLIEKLEVESDEDYEILVADRIHKHFFNDGALTEEGNAIRLQERIDETALPYIAERARWASHNGQGNRSPDSWQAYQDGILNNIFPGEDDAFVSDLRSQGLYPSIDAPEYSQHGGGVSEDGPSISVTDGDVTVYYLFGAADTNPDPYVNVLDPRTPGGGISGAATSITYDGTQGVLTRFVESGDDWSYLDDGSNQGVAWRATNFVEDADWDSGPSQLGYGNDGEVTIVDFGGNSNQKHITTYFRKSDINIPDISLYENLTLNFVFDDAIAIYVNGQEVIRENLTANAPFDELSDATVGDNATGSEILATSLFNSGNNTIAVEVHQRSLSSSDLSFDLTLTGNVAGESSSTTSAPINITTSGWLVSRAFDSSTGEWSALTEAFFSPEPINANSSNLVISEIHFNPGNPSTSEELAVSTNADDFEFIELRNVASQPLDMEGVSFTTGISFVFAQNNIIPVGGSMLLVKNRAAFESRYPAIGASGNFGSDSLGLNEFGGQLSNSGEQLVLLDRAGAVIHDFTYDDSAPWPQSSDGDGSSLVLLNPSLPIPDHAAASSWAASAQIGGQPGGADDVGFVGLNTNADADGDGINAFLEYVFGTSDQVFDSRPYQQGLAELTFNGVAKNYLTLTLQLSQHSRNAVLIEPEVSKDLDTWFGVPNVIKISETDQGNGTYTVVYRSAEALEDNTSNVELMRVVISQ